jgi:1-acyl-sn-glycerol-3-phosphate acyltransferase
VRRRRIGFWYRLAVLVLKPLLLVLTKREWRGAEHLPRSGGVIIAANHVSTLDPLTVAHFLYDNGRLPRFLAKSTLFEVPFIGRLFKGAEQIPVHRGTSDAASALAAAVEALRRGECVLIYPEGTATRDPELWPMVARTGVARLALLSGAPVVPVAHWGTQEILPYPTVRPHLVPRHRVQVLAGPPVDLSPWKGSAHDAEVLREATDAVMRRITEQLVELRGGPAPAAWYEPRSAT